MESMKNTIVVTGASCGIGRAIATAFAKEGNRVVINYSRSEDKAKELELTLRKQGYEVLAVQADIRQRDEVLAMMELVHQAFGTIDVLINNAGIAQQKLFTDITEEEWDNMFNVNIKGMFHCTQAVLPEMIRQHSGKIINVSSMWGLSGASCEVHYSASKAAVIGFTKALAKEVGPSNIHVNCIAPGVIDTDMNAALDDETMLQLKEETPLGRIGTAEDIANLTLFLASDKSSFITGQTITADGGMIL